MKLLCCVVVLGCGPAAHSDTIPERAREPERLRALRAEPDDLRGLRALVSLDVPSGFALPARWTTDELFDGLIAGTRPRRVGVHCRVHSDEPGCHVEVDMSMDEHSLSRFANAYGVAPTERSVNLDDGYVFVEVDSVLRFRYRERDQFAASFSRLLNAFDEWAFVRPLLQVTGAMLRSVGIERTQGTVQGTARMMGDELVLDDLFDLVEEHQFPLDGGRPAVLNTPLAFEKPITDGRVTIRVSPIRVVREGEPVALARRAFEIEVGLRRVR